MKTVKDTLLQRRSIRRYEREAITDEQLDFIHRAIANTPTSYNGQQFSVIEISDQPLKEQLYELTGQKQIKTCARFLLFCADFHKISLAAKAKKLEMPPFTHTVDGLIVGTVDAALAMMSAVVAAESLGLGTCCIGYARTAAPAAISDLLNLPADAYAVCGLAIGIPREIPDLKPKQPIEAVIHQNKYSDDTALTNSLLDYDATITAYNQTRAGGTTTHNDWTDHILGYYREAMDYEMLAFLARQNFIPQK